MKPDLSQLSSISEMSKDQLLLLYNQIQEEIRQKALEADISTINLRQDLAVQELKSALHKVQTQLIETNRGGENGIHGFIAEVLETGIGEAKRKFNSNPDSPAYQWINNNGPVDIQIGDINVQMKFYASDDLFGLSACQKHLLANPGFLKDNGKYMIAKDQYKQMSRIYHMGETEAIRLSKDDPDLYKTWQKLQNFFNQPGNMKFEDVQSSQITLEEAQKGSYQQTIAGQKKSINKQASRQRTEARKEHEPGFKDAAKTIGVGAALEGVLSAGMEAASLLHTKKFSETTGEDWVKVLKKGGIGTLKGGARGGFVFFGTNTLNLNQQSAAMMASLLINTADLLYQYRSGNLTEQEMLDQIISKTVDTAVSCIGAMVGKALFPTSMLAPMIGSIAASILKQGFDFAANIIKDKIIETELQKLEESLTSLNNTLEEEYQAYLAEIQQDFEIYLTILLDTFCDDPYKQMKGSIELAEYSGVPADQILYSMEDGEEYFC